MALDLPNYSKIVSNSSVEAEFLEATIRSYRVYGNLHCLASNISYRVPFYSFYVRFHLSGGIEVSRDLDSFAHLINLAVSAGGIVSYHPGIGVDVGSDSRFTVHHFTQTCIARARLLVRVRGFVRFAIS